MSDLIPFTFSGSLTVRSLVLDGKPWFIAADVCAALALETHVALRRLDDDERGRYSVPTPSSNQHGTFGTTPQQMTIINESGLYSLILTSRKPEAKAFKRWVTHEVLPAIRRTGQYAAPVARDFFDDEDEALDTRPLTPAEEAEIERLKRVACCYFRFKRQAAYGLRRVLESHFGSQPFQRWQYPLIHSFLADLGDKAAQYSDNIQSLDRLFWDGAREMIGHSRVAVDSKHGKVWDHPR